LHVLLLFPLSSAQRGGGIDYGSGGKPVPAPTIFEDLDGEGPGTKGRITAMTVAEGLDRKKIEALLKVRGWLLCLVLGLNGLVACLVLVPADVSTAGRRHRLWQRRQACSCADDI
jgi:hypothetical protein